MKVLISDKMSSLAVKVLDRYKDKGLTYDVKTGLAPEALAEIIGEYDGLIIRSASKITADILAKAANLKIIARAGEGVDNVDIPAASEKGVYVTNTPGQNTVTTAEHAIAMMMALTRKIPLGTSTMKAGLWEKNKLEGREVFRKTLGVVGLGKVGRIVADRARGLRMNVIAYDTMPVSEETVKELGCEMVSLDELYARADYITIHVPKNAGTLNLINRDAFAKMKDGVFIIQCARGGIVNEDDLYDALTSGKVSGAALDVFVVEPPPADHKLLKLDNVIATPHLGASTKEAQENVAVAAAEQVAEYLTGGELRNALNRDKVKKG